MRVSSLVGGFMMVVGTIGIVLGIGGAIVAQTLITELVADGEASLELVSDALDAADASITLAGSAVADLEATVSTAADASNSVADALGDSGVLITEVARITGEDLPESIEAVDAAMPGLIRVAGLIDNTLRAARFFGADYDPDQPFDEAVADLDASLDGMPDDLRKQAGLLEESTEDLDDIVATARRLSLDLNGLGQELSVTAGVLDEYESTAAEADLLVGELRADLDERGALVRLFALAFGLVFAVGQIVPLWLGSQLLKSGGVSGLPAVGPASVDGDEHRDDQ